MTNGPGSRSHPGWVFGVYLTLLALVFTIGLTFASVELPRLLHSALSEITPSLEGDSHADETAVFRTELFMDHFHFRLIGYVCFGLIVLLVVAGFAFGKTGLSSAGAAALFLPVFAQFAGVMFFLAGLGFLNLTWLPILDISFDAGRLGDIVYLPVNVLISLFNRLGVDIHRPLVLLLLGTGLFLFVFGTLTWFVARRRNTGLADFWVYRLSRHPQYLGWIVWSYGMLLALRDVRYPKRSWGIPASLPWLLSMMVIVGVALLEERKMNRHWGEAYDTYRGKTSFLFPLPRFLRKALTAPNRLLFRKSFPERKGEIALVLVFTTGILMVSSYFYARHRQLALLDVPVGIAESGSGRAEALAAEMKRAADWRRKSRLADALVDIGEPAVNPLIGLLDDPSSENRAEAARALGRIAPARAAAPLIEKLGEENLDVRFRAVEALGLIRSGAAVEPLLAVLESRERNLSRAAAVALGRIGSEAAVVPLLGLLDGPNWWDRAAAVDALGKIGSEDAVEALAARLEGEETHVRRSIAVALLRIGSPRARPALEKALQDDDREVRLFASQALEKIKTP